MNNITIPIEVSARHIHLDENDFNILFGENYELKVKKNVSQPGQFAAVEEVIVKGPKSSFSVRIIGPLRSQTQLEISMTDSYTLGIPIPEVRVSGDLENTPGGVTLEGPKGSIVMKKGVVVAQRHLHIEPEYAKEFGINDGDLINIEVTSSKRSMIYKDVIVRSKADVDKLSFQLDTDEANAGNITKDSKASIIME